jgi:hypothetical protein
MNYKISASLFSLILFVLVATWVKATDHPVTNAADSGPGSLRDLITNGPIEAGDSINLVGTLLPPFTIFWSSPSINIPVSSLTIDGGVLGLVTLDGGDTHQLFTWINGTGNGLALNNLVFVDGQTTNESTPTANAYGGAISSYSDSGNSTIGNISFVTFDHNTAGATSVDGNTWAHGGAISSYSNAMSIYDPTRGNSYIGYNIDGTKGNISNSVFSNNIASGNGYSDGGAHGGAISSCAISSAIGNIVESSFIGNSAIVNSQYIIYVSGGAISSYGTWFNSYIGDIIDSRFQDNLAKGVATAVDGIYNYFKVEGGAIASYSHNYFSIFGNISDSIFVDNSVVATSQGRWWDHVEAYGGALASHGAGGATIGDISNSIWEGNSVIATGGVTGRAGGGALASISYRFLGDAGGTIGNILDTTWTNNSAKAIALSEGWGDAEAFGGAVAGNVIGIIDNSYWTSNIASAQAGEDACAIGGALFTPSTVMGSIQNSNWAGNSAQAVSSRAANASGGALRVGRQRSGFGIESGGTIDNLMNTTWSGNSAIAQSDFSNAYAVGGAISAGGIGSIHNSTWTNNSVATIGFQTYAQGGALSTYYKYRGESSIISSIITSISNSTWIGNSITSNATGNSNVYGGALSSYASSGNSIIGNIVDVSWESNAATSSATNIAPGGYASAYSYAYGGALSSYANGGGTSTISDITGTLTVHSDGSSSSTSYWKSNSVSATATATGDTTDAQTYAYGGALSSYGISSTISNISGTIWESNSVTAQATGSQAYAYGGALSSFGSTSSTLGAISDSIWTGNTVTAIGNGIDPSAYAYGGAIYTTALTAPLLIKDSSFINNSATATSIFGAATAQGGAIFIDTAIGDPSLEASVVTLSASSGKTTLFQGNTVTVNGVTTPNSITFGRSLGNNSVVDAILNISPDASGTVALYDPVSIDVNNGHSFTMSINGPGNFIWGGDLSSNPSGSTIYSFNSGRVVLQPDFSLSAPMGNYVVNLTGGATGVTLVPVLTSRNQSLAIFNSPSSFTVTGGQVVIDPVYTGSYFSGSQSWLLTNASGTVTAGNFTTASNASFTSSIYHSGSDLYIVLGELAIPTPTVDPPVDPPPTVDPPADPPPTVDPPADPPPTVDPPADPPPTVDPPADPPPTVDPPADPPPTVDPPADPPPTVDPPADPPPTVDPPADPPPTVDPPAAPLFTVANMSQNFNPNVRVAYDSGALSAALDQQLTVDSSIDYAAHNAVNSYPQIFTGEALMNQGMVALNTAETLADRAWKLSQRPRLPASVHADTVNNFRIRPWAGYIWENSQNNGSGGLFGYDSTMNGGIGGFSADFGELAIASLYFAKTGGNNTANGLQTEIDSDTSTIGGMFSIALLPQLQLGFETGITQMNSEGARYTPFGNYESAYDQTVSVLGGNLGFDIPLGTYTLLNITPALRHLRLNQDAINESGTNPTWGVHADDTNADSLVSTLSSSLTHEILFNNGMSIIPTVYAEWKHKSGDTAIDTIAELGTVGPSYPLSSVAQDRDAAKLGMSLTGILYSYEGVNLVVELEYYATLSDNETIHFYHFGMNVDF